MILDSGCNILLIDQRPAYLQDSRFSLLTAPLGSSTLLSHVLEELQRCAPQSPLCIVPQFPVDPAYPELVHATCAHARVLAPAELSDFLAELEPSDRILVLDPSHMPLDGLKLSTHFHGAKNDHAAIHLVPMAATSGVSGERVQLDAHQRVRRIQRYYAGITDVQASGAVATFLSVSCLRAIDDLTRISPGELRAGLMLRDVPSRDITLPGTALDLTIVTQLLELNRRLMERGTEIDPHRGPAPARRGGSNGVRRHSRAIVHATARIYGPVYLDDGCEVEARAVIVGPAVIGRGARVGAGAVIANAIIHDGVHVPDGTLQNDCVVSNHGREVVRVNGRNGSSARARFAARTAGELLTNGRRYRSGAADCAFKRAMDVCLSIFGLMVLSPLLLLTAVLVWLTSRGPALFGHVREGRNGREFRCWKFRTMVADAHAQQRSLYKKSHVDGPQFKMDGDPRVTRLGRWLRATNIDELPQLYNVLRGHMSLIGPRPSPFRENQICVPWRKVRLSVRPGITGLWQVCRHERGAGDFHQWIHFDMMYVRNWSLATDLRILAATILTLGGRFSVPVRWIVSNPTPAGAEYGNSLDQLEKLGLSASAEWMGLRPRANGRAGLDAARENPVKTLRRTHADGRYDESRERLDYDTGAPGPSASRMAQA